MKFLLLLVILMNSAFACPVEPHEFMFAQMKGFSGGESVSESGITKEIFEEVLTRAKDHYLKAFEAHGLEVDFTMDWANTWFNAQTGWSGAKKVRFFFSGELARGKYMTPDALLYVACHEMGHHFGGFPKKSWSTAEGGADYFAALKCMRDILKNDPENAKAEEVVIHEDVRKKCQEVYSDADDFHLCLRTAKAGEDMARTFEYRAKKTEQTESFFFRPLPEAATTIVGYPTRECRAETAYQGAICNKGPEFPISFVNETEGYCHEKNGDTFGMRPKCWFKPALE
ncbi:MAG: hypothetical protein V4598_00160 [Bdellovibrionota bacterium]